MIEVTAKLPGRSVFLAGEVVECAVTFTNVATVGNRQQALSSPGRKMTIKLAWASAQIHCQCSVSDNKVVLPKPAILSASEVTTTGNETSFVPSKGEKGASVLATKPTILFCDLALAPGESKRFMYKEALPIDAPPSFRGSLIKYSYKITIGAQRFSYPTRLLRIPIRVLVVPGLNDISAYQDEDTMRPSNPFLRRQQKENSLLEIALEILQTITCRKGPNFYNITNSRGKVARFCLFKQAYRIGEDIIGTCDFSQATIPCVQYSVTLQSEEEISNDYRAKNCQGTTISSYSKHHEFCLHTSKTHISIPIPLTASPGFVTDIVSLKWRLHFEFVTTKGPLPKLTEPQDAEESALWRGPSQLDVETLVWDLPIKVFATNPVPATVVSLLKLENSCLV